MLQCTSAAWKDCSIFSADTCKTRTADRIPTRRRGWARRPSPPKRQFLGRPRRSYDGRPSRRESAGAACCIRQSRAPGGREGSSRPHAARPALSRASGLPSPEPDRAHIARSRNLSSPARPGSSSSKCSGVGPGAAARRAGFMEMTAGELLAAAHRFPFRSLRESLEDRPFVVMAPHPDDESLACGGLIAEACRQRFQVETHRGQRRGWIASKQQGLSASPTEGVARGGGKTSGGGAWGCAATLCIRRNRPRQWPVRTQCGTVQGLRRRKPRAPCCECAGCPLRLPARVHSSARMWSHARKDNTES